MYKIIQILNSRNPDPECIVIPEKIDKVYLIQSVDDENCLSAIATVGEYALLFYVGCMNFHSNHGGMKALNDFRCWLTKHNLKNIELKYVTDDYWQAMIQDGIFDPGQLVANHSCRYVESLFRTWLIKSLNQNDISLAIK